MYELTIRRNSYIYFWHYETRDGVRRQVKEYLGPAGSPEARAEGVRRCEAYYVRMHGELRKLRKTTLASIAARR